MGFDALSPIVDAISSQISVTTVAAVVAGALGIAVGLVFFWWAGRKLARVIMGAFKKGKLSV